MIKFKEITNQNLERVLNLKVRKEQKTFVASNILSLAEALATRNEGNIALPYAIYDDRKMIGFIMFGYDSDGSPDTPNIAKGNYCLWRLMFDKKYQHQGYFKAVLQTVLDYLRSFPTGPAEYVWLSYEPENEYGKALYNKYGFIENGEHCCNEIVAVKKL